MRKENYRAYIENRTMDVGAYIARSKATVREASLVFHLSKSVLHRDVTERLLELNPRLHAEVAKVLKEHKEDRHMRGGLATKERYEGRKRISI